MRNSYGFEVADPVIPWPLWPAAIVFGLCVAWAIKALHRR